MLSICLSGHLFFLKTQYLLNGLKDFCETLVKCLSYQGNVRLMTEPCLMKVKVRIQGQSSNGNVLCSLKNFKSLKISS